MALVALVSACATYHPKPLPETPNLASQAYLEVPVKQLVVPGWQAHPFNPANGLDITETVTLAVLNNPGLKAKRLQAGVADAQLLQAGLLPNPQLSSCFLTPITGPPLAYNAYTFGLTEDLSALVSRGAALAAARANQAKVNLNILWQEWQVEQKARQLFIAARAQAHLDQLLQTQHRLNARHYRRDRNALHHGNLTLSTTSADLVALVNANTQLRQLQRQRNQTWHALDGLLGLQPSIKPKLTGPLHLRPFSKAQFTAALAQLPHRRPDLLALEAGYESQEDTVRKAILQQFPTLSIGPAGERDNGLIGSIGFNINLSLPLFNHNQGHIAIARATRAVLRATYQARLDSAVNTAHKMWREVRIQHRQLTQLDARLPQLEATTDAAQRSFAQGNMSAGTYINLRLSLLSKKVEAIRLISTLQQAQAALETLLGMTLNPPNSPTASAVKES